jgi:hypothetical protein
MGWIQRSKDCQDAFFAKISQKSGVTPLANALALPGCEKDRMQGGNR